MIKQCCDVCRQEIEKNYGNGSDILISQGTISIRISATVGSSDGALCKPCVEKMIVNNTWNLVNRDTK